MSIKWSAEQEKAITYSTAESGSAIVSAAAGSGKTAVLVERITRMIIKEEPKIPADKIAAVTFTDAAAGELKSRLEETLNKLRLCAESNSVSAEWLNRQLISLENARICTISSFCLALLRDFAEDAGLKPDFKICEGKESESFSDSALNFALEAIYDGVSFTPEEKAALRSMTGEAGDSKLGNAILELYEEYVKQPFPESWLGEKKSLYKHPESLKKLIAETSENEIREKARACLPDIEECFNYSYSDSMNQRLETDRNFAESWAKLEYADLSKGKKGLLKYGNSSYGNPAEKHKEAKSVIKELRDSYIPVFKEIIVTAGLLIDFDFVVRKQAGQVDAFTKLFRLYETEFKRLKTEANRIDFSDAEHYCLELMQNETIAEKIRAAFYEIIVDEFQDSNAVQYEIFKKISRQFKNLFFVGDVKQSIYRFRNADPRVFVGVTEDKANFKTLTLNKNFRSSPQVVNAVNNIFEKNMTKEIGGVDYNEDAKLVFGAQNAGGKECEAELVIIETEQEISGKSAEADYIAERINKMVSEKFQVADKDGKKRDCNYGDFAVLISGLSTVEEEFSNAFEIRGLPCDKQKSGDYAEVREVKTILSLLTIIERPFECLELLKTLMSPLYGFTARDIAEIRRDGRNKALFDNIEEYQSSEKPSPAYKKARRFYEDYRRRSSYVKNYGACRLIRLLCDEGAFNPLIAASANPEKTLINVRLLLHYSENLKSLTRDTLSGLINVLGGKSGAKLEEARFPGEADTEKVKIMTIHASKGLEFPVCFVARNNAKFNLRENYSDIIFSEEIGVAMRYIIPETNTRCDTLTHAKAKLENETSARAEEMRKLYVACTRARDKLILTAACENFSENQKVTEKSYLNWLIKTDVEKFIIKASEIEPIVKNGKSAQDTEEEIKISREEQTREIIKSVKRTYSRQPLTEIPRRVTATQIGVRHNSAVSEGYKEDGEILLSGGTDDMADEPTVFPRSPSFMGNKKLTGKKRGDAYHKMMEIIDFKEPDYEKQIEKQKSRFTEEEFAAIEPRKIMGFFNSPLGKRAVKSPKIHKEFMLCTEISLSELGYPKEYDDIFDDKPFVQGIADMFFYEDGGIILVDYKTNRNITCEKLIEQYSGQLEIYARAIEEMTGGKVTEKWIYSFEVGEIKIIDN
ncbi:MAG: UvrD-helicase domain-containing protein [Oscillospiraceae bacterium]|nr:UvrD-helicase domain-containing protein [Oscillospiraceae bacterium]